MLRTKPAGLLFLSSLLMGSAALVAASPVHAQTSSTPSGQIEEVVVTAQKREERANKVPMSITAVSGSKLQELGIVQPRDLMKIAPSFNYTDSGAASPIYSIRGVGFNDIALGSRPTVSIYTDQAPIPFSIETRGASLDLQRVEVLEGPQGTLFGQNATGGAINYIAAKPTDTFSAGANVGYGNYNAFDVSGFVSGPISDTLTGRIALETDQSGGWQKSYTTGQHNGGTDFTNGRVLLDWTPSAKLDVQLNVNGYADYSQVQAAQLIAITPEVAPFEGLVPGLLTYPLAPKNDTSADWTPGDYHRHNIFFQANLRGDYSLGDGMTLTSISSYSHFSDRQLQDIDGTTLQNLSQETHGKIQSASEELRLSGPLDGDRGHFDIGANYAYDQINEDDLDNNEESTLAYFLTPYGLPIFKDFVDISNQTENTYAAFASGDYKITPSIDLYGGIRYTRSIDHYNGCTADAGDGSAAADFGGFDNILRGAFGLPPISPIPNGGCVTLNETTLEPGLVHSKLNQSNFPWRAGVSWAASDDAMLYANVSKGFKAGSFPELGATSATQLLPARQETLLAYEAGFKLGLFDRSLQLNGSVFHYDYTDKQVLGKVVDPVLGTLLKLINVPKSQINGAEMHLDWVPLDGLTLSAGASYIDSEILDNYTGINSSGVLQDFGGEAFPNTPKWELVADARYQWSLSSGYDAFVGAGLTYHSKSNSQLGDIPLLYVKAYSLVDLRAGILSTDDVWSATAWVHNVGNTYYWTSANQDLDTTTRFTGMPRTYGIEIGYRFN
ncbi:MAG TPA: TonB-dependent receptor [Rhizomicrobium sp.]|jgi:outer membrane receptor protein involved in Fe transport